MNEGKERPRAPVPIRDVTPARGSGEDPPEERDPLQSGPQPVGTDEDRRPTPVRMAMETEEDLEDLSPGPEAIRTFENPATGSRWTAEVTGRSMSGVLPVRTVPLLEVVFRPEDSDGPPLKRAVHQGESLAGFTDAEMIELLARAEDYREPMSQPSGKSSSPRKRKRKPSKD